MFKRFLKITGITLGLLLILAVVLTELFEDRISTAIISEVQNQLTTDFSVASFDLSLLRSFPRVSANLGGVEIEDTRGHLLLESERISFRFGLLSLLRSNINLRSVLIYNGALRISLDEAGNANYDIFKTPETEPETDSESDLSISLAQATLEDMELIYEDEGTEQNVYLDVSEATFSGEISSTKFELTSTAQLYSNFIETGTARYLAGKSVGYDARVLVNLDEGIYEFNDVTINIEGNTYRLTGTIDEEPGFTEVDLAAGVEDGSLEAITQLLPAQYLQRAGGLRSRGTFYFNATAQGRYNSRTNPAIQVDFGLQEGRITSDLLAGDLKDVTFDASFTNGEKQRNSTSRFQLNNFRAYLDRERIEGTLDLQNLDDPQIEMYVDGTLPLNSTYGLLGSHVTGGEGEIEIQNLRISGRYSDMVRNTRVGRVDMTGTIEFDDTGVTINGERMRLDRGTLGIKDNLLSVRDLELEGAGTEMVLNGTFNNLLPVLLADSLNSRDAFLEFEAELTAREIDLGRLAALSAGPAGSEAERQTRQQAAQQPTKTEHREWLASFLQGTFNARIDRYTYNKIEGTDFAGELRFHDREMKITGETNAMEGRFTLDGKMLFFEEPYLDVRLTASEVNINEFFRQTENFGQETLTDEHVSGTLNSKMRIIAYFDNEGNFLDEKLYVLAGIGLENGRLQDFALLESFSDFVHIEELRDIEIVSLQNYLEISDRTIRIPVMFIQSSALNLTVSGSHTFDNYLNYNIKVNAGQVVFNKIKKYDPTMEPVKAQRRGWINLYYKIEGPLESYDYRTAKREVKQDFEQSEHLKRELRVRLINTFDDIQLIEEPEEWNDIPEYSGFEEEEEEEYLEGFDDWR